MSEKNIAKIACRVIAIYIMIKGLEQAFYLFGIFYYKPSVIQGFDRNTIIQMILGSIIPLAFYIILGIILWVKATKISNYMIDDDTENNKTNINVNRLQSAAFSVVGLIILVKLIPEILNFIPRLAYFSGDYIPKETIIWLEIKVSIIGIVIKFIIGLLLLFKSRGLVGFIKGLQKAGLRDLDKQ